MATHDTSDNTPSTPLLAALEGRLAGRSEHARFQGPPLDLSALTPEVLGAVWAQVRRASIDPQAHPLARETAQQLLQHMREQGCPPRLEAHTAASVFATIEAGHIAVARTHLGYLAAPPGDDVKAHLRRILQTPEHWDTPPRTDLYKVHALAVWLEDDWIDALKRIVRHRYAASPLRRDEFELLEQLSPAAVQALAGLHDGYDGPLGLPEDTAHPAEVLAQEPAYIAFSRTVLETATRQVDDIHAARQPYRADAAFTSDDAQVIARAARVAAWRDDPWLGPLLMRLLPGACSAPNEQRTAVSQSLTIALGHVVESLPTPEGVQALRQARSVVRHAGLAKKLTRHLKPAERALAARPAVALRLTAPGPRDRKHEALLAACLEAGYVQDLSLPWDEWQERLLHSATGRAVAHALVWEHLDSDGPPRSFLPQADPASCQALDAQGHALPLPANGRVRLWHPVRAPSGECRLWQSLVAERRLRQPVRQVFREHYRPAEDERTAPVSARFSGIVLSLQPLLGLARKEGWQIDLDGGLERRFGPLRVRLGVEARLYPGIQGHAATGLLGFDTPQGPTRALLALAEVEPVIFSEACRAVDLLVSVAGFAWAGPEAGGPAPRRSQHLEELARMSGAERLRTRREALATALAPRIAAGDIVLDDRHVRVGAHAVHLSTGIVSRDGEAVELPPTPSSPRLAAVPWLPYDEALLQRIADAVGTLLALASGTETASSAPVPPA